MPDENTASYLLDQLAEDHERDVWVIDKGKFALIINILIAKWTLYSLILNTREINTLYSYLRPLILERQDGELWEGVRKVLGHLPDRLLQFLSYTINLVLNNLLFNTDVDRIVLWINNIQGYKLLAKLLFLKGLTT
jgi:hypothetical protein